MLTQTSGQEQPLRGSSSSLHPNHSKSCEYRTSEPPAAHAPSFSPAPARASSRKFGPPARAFTQAYNSRQRPDSNCHGIISNSTAAALKHVSPAIQAVPVSRVKFFTRQGTQKLYGIDSSRPAACSAADSVESTAVKFQHRDLSPKVLSNSTFQSK